MIQDAFGLKQRQLIIKQLNHHVFPPSTSKMDSIPLTHEESFTNIRTLNHTLADAKAKCCKCGTVGSWYPLQDTLCVNRATCKDCTHHFCMECMYETDDLVAFGNMIEALLANDDTPRDLKGDGIWGWICCKCGRCRTMSTEVLPDQKQQFHLDFGRIYCKEDHHYGCDNCVCLKKTTANPPSQASIQAICQGQRTSEGFWKPMRNPADGKLLKTVEFASINDAKFLKLN
jgi:hypothetical protein